MNSTALPVRETNEPIAIVGIGCRFPGGASSASKLWDVLKNPPQLAKRIPSDRFNLDRFYHPDGSHHGTFNVKETYFLDEDIRTFDNGFFGIPPGEAAAMDPQHRLLMETVYEAMETAGLTIPSMQGSDTAVYVGVMCSDYYILHGQDFNHVPKYNATGIANSNASARLSYFFDWHGPCMTIDTACSSSMVALHEAVQTLRAGTSRVAVAAGTSLALSPMMYISEASLSMLSPTGRSQMWDADADGYARGEGVAAVILKKLSDAIADGDKIECVIRETGVNQDGRTKGITMPSATSQAALIRDTYARAGLDIHSSTDRCQYFEAHGTGTPAGDPQEAEALHTAFVAEASRAENRDPLYVGSIKTVIGHTEGTAGLAGLLKAYLAIKHGLIPPNLHFKKLSPTVAPFYEGLQLVTSPQPWPSLPVGVPRRASINSFGFGGTNAHAIIESYTPPVKALPVPSPSVATGRQILPFVFSAASQASLRGVLESYQSYLDTANTVDMQGLAHTLACQRTTFPFKLALSAQGKDSLIAKIRDVLSSNEISALDTRSANAGTPSILGVFTGQGAQWPRMGAELLATVPYARRIIETLDQSLASLPNTEDRPNWRLIDELQKDGSTSRVTDAAFAQPMTAAIQIMLVNLLHEAGVSFRAVVGHSSGEIAAAYAAGFISMADAIRIAYYRGLYSQLAVGPEGKTGGMIAVGTSLEDAREFCDLEDFQGRLTVAASNSPTSITISGDVDAIEEAQIIFEEEGKFVRRLRVDKAYHSHHMKAATEPFLEGLRSCGIEIITPSAGAPSWFSSAYEGTTVQAHEGLLGPYWTHNMNNTVLFSQALETAVKKCGAFDSVVEVGPHPALKGPASDVLKGACNVPAVSYISPLSRGKDDVDATAEALGELWTIHGANSVDFLRYQQCVYDNADKIAMLHDLPGYSWTHDRPLWSEGRYTKLLRQQPGVYHDLLGTRIPDGTEEAWRWRNVLIPKELPWLPDHALQGQTVFPAMGYVALALEAAMQIANSTQREKTVQLLELTDVCIAKAVAIDDTAGTEILVTMTEIKQTTDGIRACFSFFSAPTKDSPQLVLNATAGVQIFLGEQGVDEILPPRTPSARSLNPVDVENFYREVGKLGYDYGPSFRGLKALERSLGVSRGMVMAPSNDGLLAHPGMLDSALQGLLLALGAPGDGTLWSLHVPSTMRRVSLVPSLCGVNMTSEVAFDCSISQIAGSKIAGDVDIFQADSHLKSISIEGVTFVPFSEARASDDRNLFSHTLWSVEHPDGQLALGSHRATPQEIQTGYDVERVAFYYLRTLLENVGGVDLNLPDHHEALLDYARYICDMVGRGEHQFVKQEYMGDTYDEIISIMDKYDAKEANFALTRAVGERLPAVLRGETSMLEHMRENNALDNYYKHAAGFARLNELIATMAGQISHRYPRMNVLEIGAGTGGATRGVLETFGTAYTSYTYTDISSGFFEKAQENFSVHKDRIVYKTLDITRDPADQGFEEASYDLVLAANVLHATPNLEETLTNARKLLRPGGFLLLMEFVDVTPMRYGLIFGGLPGWWMGRETGRRYGPIVSTETWHELLLKTGFSGVDTSTPVHDPVVMAGSILVSRAVDKDINMLMAPMSSANTIPQTGKSGLVIMGGSTPTTRTIIDEVQAVTKNAYEDIVHASSWDELQLEKITERYSILCLTDFDNSTFWENMTESRFAKFKKLFSSPRNVLWATWGAERENADGAMTIGFFRSLRYELPDSQLQILDFEKPQGADASSLVERLFRLEVTAQWRNGSSGSTRLWTTEPEIRIRKGSVEIPRLYLQMDQNARYNSAKRDIFKSADIQNTVVELLWKDNKYAIREQESKNLPSHHGYRKVQMDSSLLPSMATERGRLYFGLGTDMDTSERVLLASCKNASAVSIPSTWATPVDCMKSIDAQYLSFMSGYLMSQYIASLIPQGSTALVHEADSGLASLLSRQLASGGSRVVFTTSAVELERSTRRNWIHLHPRIMDRHLDSLLPREVSVYFDLSSAASMANTSESSDLGKRIAAKMRSVCTKYDASALIGRISAPLSGLQDDGIQQMLAKANEFASTQLNGVPDGMPLRMVPLSHIAAGEGASTDTEAMTIVDWRADPTIPVLTEPISRRNDLFGDNKTYWLLGLAGDLGRSICDYMIEHGARHVVLTSRHPQIDQEWVYLHATRGATIVYIAADITMKSEVENAHSRIVSSCPPIAGVANGALVLRDTSLGNMDLETLHANTKAKVLGTTYLDHLFPENTLDWFVAFSSLASMVGNHGQGGYTAANLFMKALIAQRRHRGLAGSVIDIAQVVGVGYIARETQKNAALSREQAMRLTSRSGAFVMSETDLHQLFAEAIIAGRPGSNLDPEIITGLRVISTAEAKETLWGDNVKFGHFIQDIGLAKLPSVAKSGAIPVKKLLEAAKNEDEMGVVLRDAFVRKLKHSLLMSESDSINEVSPLVDLGVDSLVAVEIRTWFAQEVGTDLAVLKILGGSSIQDLVDDTVQKLATSSSDKAESTAEPAIASSSESGSGESESGDTQSSRSSVLADIEAKEEKPLAVMGAPNLKVRA
ncbi:putative polyketide synthase [Thozetella sp. PMI_491]|nr:putative polyketide synthase [Thozetella sp. PMI_491]